MQFDDADVLLVEAGQEADLPAFRGEGVDGGLNARIRAEAVGPIADRVRAAAADARQRRKLLAAIVRNLAACSRSPLDDAEDGVISADSVWTSPRLQQPRNDSVRGLRSRGDNPEVSRVVRVAVERHIQPSVTQL